MRDAAQEETAFRDTVRCSAEAYARFAKVCGISSLPLHQKELARNALRALGRFTMSQSSELMQQPILPKRDAPPVAPPASTPGFGPRRNSLSEALEAGGDFWETAFDLLSGPNRLSEEHRTLALDALNKVDAFVISVWEDEPPAPRRVAGGEHGALRF